MDGFPGCDRRAGGWTGAPRSRQVHRRSRDHSRRGGGHRRPSGFLPVGEGATPPPSSALTEPKPHSHAPTLTESSRRRWPASGHLGEPPSVVVWMTVRIGCLTIAGRRFRLSSLAWHPGLLGIRSETSLQGHQQPLREPFLSDHVCLGSEIWSESGEGCARVGAGTHGFQAFAPAAPTGQPARRRK